MRFALVFLLTANAERTAFMCNVMLRTSSLHARAVGFPLFMFSPAQSFINGLNLTARNCCYSSAPTARNCCYSSARICCHSSARICCHSSARNCCYSSARICCYSSARNCCLGKVILMRSVKKYQQESLLFVESNRLLIKKHLF